VFNATVEALCDFLEAVENRKIGIIKDIAAAAAGISILAWCVVLAVEVVRVWQVTR
jgi:diacylglycerol kinase (ATP)